MFRVKAKSFCRMGEVKNVWVPMGEQCGLTKVSFVFLAGENFFYYYICG